MVSFGAESMEWDHYAHDPLRTNVVVYRLVALQDVGNAHRVGFDYAKCEKSKVLQNVKIAMKDDGAGSSNLDDAMNEQTTNGDDDCDWNKQRHSRLSTNPMIPKLGGKHRKSSIDSIEWTTERVWVGIGIKCGILQSPKHKLVANESILISILRVCVHTLSILVYFLNLVLGVVLSGC